VLRKVWILKDLKPLLIILFCLISFQLALSLVGNLGRQFFCDVPVLNDINFTLCAMHWVLWHIDIFLLDLSLDSSP